MLHVVIYVMDPPRMKLQALLPQEEDEGVEAPAWVGATPFTPYCFMF